MRVRTKKLFKFDCGISPDILAVGISTMCVAITTTAFFSISPFYLRDVLGIGLVTLGLIESITEALSQLSRLLSGMISDFIKKHKPMFLLGIILSAIARPLFFLANSAGMIAIAKTFDRLGNGISATPRDAYVAERSKDNQMGRSIGLVMTFKTIGCVLGPIVVMCILSFYKNFNLQLLLILMSIPSFFAIIICVLYMKNSDINQSEEKVTTDDKSKNSDGFSFKEIFLLKKSYWWFIAIMGIFMLARVPESYLLLNLKDTGLPSWFCSGAIGFFNFVSVLISYPVGKLSDKIDRPIVLIFSFLTLMISLFCFSTNSCLVCIIGVIFWGIQRSSSQILSVACIADVVDKKILGTAIGMLNLVSGLSGIISGYISGIIAEKHGLFSSYKIATIVAFIATAVLFLFIRSSCNQKKLGCELKK